MSATDFYPDDRQPTVRVVAMPEFTNATGNIFGGWIMAQMDLAGSIIAVERADGPVATVAVQSMAFHAPVHVGDLLSCYAEIERSGRTSVTVRIDVHVRRHQRSATPPSEKVTEAVITYVKVDPEGRPSPLPQP
ncbi:acyl-CoA thioesterase [Plasticicumulans acidivorans]|uniref:Acyl-CoA thioesterase YciA n=1 Tax=Plasticicumulans acidivorans TaxID=886464 RepID=A0A317MU73_9GAMM|nr:acyl-CoA thioesterase [Plasticicumulans acidivorans]PWV61185.1 acyl-CoA thioesterase YciA [Plasticicumulans acidivorans]